MKMTLKKGIAVSLISMFIVLIAVIIYLFQPSGKVTDFKAWQSNVDAPHQGLTVRFFGVSTLLFDDGQDQILIDGFFTRPDLWHVLSSKISGDFPLLVQLKRQYELHRTQAIFVTHSHYDHALDIPHLSELLPQAKIVGSRTTLNIARANNDIAESQLILAQPKQSIQIGQFKVTPIPSAHTPPTAVNDDLGKELKAPLQLPAKFSAFTEGGSFDYLIEHGDQKILVKASTGFIPNQLDSLKVDTLFLGIAQLSKQDQNYQNHYLAESLQKLQPKVVIPIHWDNFFKPLNQPLEFLPNFADQSPQSLRKLINVAEQQNSKVVLLTQPVAYPLQQYD